MNNYENNESRFSRRSALKLFGGAAATAAFADSSKATRKESITTDRAGNSTWVLRFDSGIAVADTESVEEAAAEIYRSQQAAIDQLAGMDGYEVESQFWIANAVLVTAEKEWTTAEVELAALDGVDRVHPNYEIPGPEPVEQQTLIPQDHDRHQYGLEQINVPDAWEQFAADGSGTSVAVLDTGIDADHPDLTLSQWAEFDATGQEIDSEPYDPDGHGTHVSGTVAGGRATGIDGEPHLGVAPGAELYSGKVLDEGGTFTQVIAGIEWAVEQNVDVINMSLGASGNFDEMIEPVQSAVASGTAVVSSIGNGGPETSGSPGNVYETLAIGASDPAGQIAGFSSGELVKTSEDWIADWLTEDWPLNYYVPDVAAPGTQVLSTYPDGSYARLSGTSMASPHVTGAVALLLSIDPDLRGDVDGIKSAFEQTARHGDGPEATPDMRYGDGIVDVLSSAAVATDGNTVEGTVTTTDGEPVEGVPIRSDFGTETETTSEGEFSLSLADGEWNVTVDQFGLETVTRTVTVEGGETVSESFELGLELSVAPLAGQPDVIDQGESFDIVVELAHAESITITPSDESDVGAESLSLAIGDTELTPGEPFEPPSPVSGQVPVSVTVAGDAPLGTLSLVHEFDGPGDPITVQTGPTEVMADPEDASLQIVDWDETQEVVMGETLELFAVVENTGDRTARQPVEWWLGDPDGPNVFPAGQVELQGGEQATVPFRIDVPTGFLPAGEQLPHGWQTADDSVSTTAEFFGPEFVFGELDAPDQVDYGETMTITVPVENAGNLAGSDTVGFTFDGVFLDSAEVSADVGESDSVTFEFDSSRVVRGRYQYAISGTLDSVTGSVWIGPVQGPPPIVGDNRPRDLTGDGLYEDIDGNGEADFFDVQALFDNRQRINNEFPEYTEFFNFSGNSPDEVTIFDVQALSERVRNL